MVNEGTYDWRIEFVCSLKTLVDKLNMSSICVFDIILEFILYVQIVVLIQ